MIDSSDQVFLRGAGLSGDKNRVIAADIADHLRPVAAIKGERNTLRGADGRFDHQQVGAGRVNVAQQFGDGGNLPVTVLAVLR